MLIARCRTVLRSLAATRHGIGARLLTGVLVFSGSVTLILTALQLYIDYRRDISALEVRLNQIGESYLGSLAEGLWNLDENQLRLQLSGILRLPDIRAVEVREAGSTGHPLIVKLGETSTSFARVQEYQLIHNAQGRARTIGTLRIEATLAEVYERLVDTALTILVTQAAKTFLVSLFILYIFHHLVTRHLSSIAADLGSYRINGKPLELSLQRRQPCNQDELQLVVTAFNTLSRDLHVAYGDLRDVNDELAKDVADRRKTEAILRERDARIRRLIDANIIGIVIWNLDGEILEANDAFLRIVGYDRQDLTADRIRWTDLTPPEFRDRDELAQREISTTSIAQPYEKEFVSKDGPRVPVLIGAANFEADAKEGVAFVLDISERKRAEVELRESEQNYRMLFEAIDEGFCTIEVLFDQNEKPVDYRFLQINPSFERQTGIKNAVGKRMREIAPQHEEHWFEIYGRIALAGEPMRFENEAKQLGRWYDVYAFRVEDPKRRRVGILFNDITDRKRAEEDLRRSEASLTQAQRISHTGSWRWNVGTGAVSSSAELLHIFGFDPTAARPCYATFMERINPEDRPLFEQLLAQAVRERSRFQYEYRIVLADGSVKYLQSVGQPETTGAGDLEFVGTVMDMTERRRAEEALRNAQAELIRVARLTTMGELLASIAHEINQPLAAVATSGNACLRWLNRDKPDLDEARDAASRVVRDAHRAGDVIRSLRALTQKSGPQLTQLDIHDAIKGVLALTRGELQQHGIVLHTDLAAGDRPVLGDRVQLQQVLLNLIVNGIQAMGAVTDRKRELTVSVTRAEPDHVQIAVADTGPGLDPTIAQRIFEPFFTTKSDGLGMGLSICRSIIEAHGGTLWVSPRAPHGTAFHFTIPIAG